jgi:hypothetical protein
MNAGALVALVAPDDRAELARAAYALEHTSFAMRLAELAGQPVSKIFAKLPSFGTRQLNAIVEKAILSALEVAISSMDEADREETPSAWVPRVIAGITGGIGGFFGAFALPMELPLTTMVMLRSIAEIAQSRGEDLSLLPSRLACLEVFALGARGARERENQVLTYYATRAALAGLTREAATVTVRQCTAGASASLAARAAATISARFGPAVAERLAATAVPIAGLIGGATINMVFMEHYQQLAHAHFTIRALERRYGGATVEALFGQLAAGERRGEGRPGALPLDSAKGRGP